MFTFNFFHPGHPVDNRIFLVKSVSSLLLSLFSLLPCISTHDCVYIYICIYVYKYMYVCVSLCGYICVYIFLCVYIYRYYTMTNVYTATKFSSDDDSGFGHGFGAEASLLLTQSAPAVTHDTTRLCWIDISQWDCHIHTDVVRALSWIVFMYFPLSDGECPRLVKNMEVELVMTPWHPTSIENSAVSDSLFLQILIFSNWCWCAQSKIS